MDERYLGRCIVHSLRPSKIFQDGRQLGRSAADAVCSFLIHRQLHSYSCFWLTAFILSALQPPSPRQRRCLIRCTSLPITAHHCPSLTALGIPLLAAASLCSPLSLSPYLPILVCSLSPTGPSYCLCALCLRSCTILAYGRLLACLASHLPTACVFLRIPLHG
jgi:hypothetical protein